MMLLLKALLALKMLTAASPLPGAYELCSEEQGCSTGLRCEEGACTPNHFCLLASECPAGPDGYPAVCELNPSDDGDYGFCQVGPIDGECPDGFTPDRGIEGIDICVR